MIRGATFLAHGVVCPTPVGHRSVIVQVGLEGIRSSITPVIKGDTYHVGLHVDREVAVRIGSGGNIGGWSGKRDGIPIAHGAHSLSPDSRAHK